MQLLVLNVAACAVALIYCIYQTHCRLVRKQHQKLRQRVAYLLWSAAQRADSNAELIRS